MRASPSLPFLTVLTLKRRQQ